MEHIIVDINEFIELTVEVLTEARESNADGIRIEIHKDNTLRMGTQIGGGGCMDFDFLQGLILIDKHDEPINRTTRKVQSIDEIPHNCSTCANEIICWANGDIGDEETIEECPNWKISYEEYEKLFELNLTDRSASQDT